jgi:hypothetical protein
MHKSLEPVVYTINEWRKLNQEAFFIEKSTSNYEPGKEWKRQQN